MANLVPKYGGSVYDAAQEFHRWQKEATNQYDDAQLMLSRIAAVPLREVSNFADQCAAKSVRFATLKNKPALQDYANRVHPDANYDLDAAIDVCVAAYDTFATAYKNFIASGNAKDRIDIDKRTLDMTAVQNLLDGIVATVEDI